MSPAVRGVVRPSQAALQAYLYWALPAPPLPLLIETLLEHILLIGLPLGILARRHTEIEK